MRCTIPCLPTRRHALACLLLATCVGHASAAEEGSGKVRPDREFRDAPLLRDPFIADPSAPLFDEWISTASATA